MIYVNAVCIIMRAPLTVRTSEGSACAGDGFKKGSSGSAVLSSRLRTERRGWVCGLVPERKGSGGGSGWISSDALFMIPFDLETPSASMHVSSGD